MQPNNNKSGCCRKSVSHNIVMKNPIHRTGTKGFTIGETLIVLLLVGVFVGIIGLPHYHDTETRNKAIGLINVYNSLADSGAIPGEIAGSDDVMKKVNFALDHTNGTVDIGDTRTRDIARFVLLTNERNLLLGNNPDY